MREMRLTNEGKACDAVVTLLESETGFRREDVRPHADAGNGKNVELRLKLGDREYAIEHTLIETFEGLTYAEKLFLEQGRNLTTNLAGKLPIPGWYYLSLPYGSWTQIKREDRIHIQQTLNRWVCVKAHELYCKNPGR